MAAPGGVPLPPCNNAPMTKRPQPLGETIAKRLRHGIALLAAMAVGAWPAMAVAAPRLRCQISQGGDVRQLEFAPASNPYSARAVDISEHFRFKAVVIGDDGGIDSIALYAYYRSPRQAVLLHQAKYLAPVPQRAPAPAALTGLHYLYAPGLERELQYGCALIEVGP